MYRFLARACASIRATLGMMRADEYRDRDDIRPGGGCGVAGRGSNLTAKHPVIAILHRPAASGEVSDS